MAGESISSSSEGEEPQTTCVDQVKLEENLSQQSPPPKLINVELESPRPRSFIGEVCYSNFFQKHNIEKHISKEDQEAYTV